MDKGSEEADPKAAEAEKERLEAMAEQEAERKAKHDKFEQEREKERQRIRDKVNTLLILPDGLIYLKTCKITLCTTYVSLQDHLV